MICERPAKQELGRGAFLIPVFGRARGCPGVCRRLQRGIRLVGEPDICAQLRPRSNVLAGTPQYRSSPDLWQHLGVRSGASLCLRGQQQDAHIWVPGRRRTRSFQCSGLCVAAGSGGSRYSGWVLAGERLKLGTESLLFPAEA